MKRNPTDETDDLLPPGAAEQQVDFMARLYGGSARYRTTTATKTCLTCMGKGTLPRSNRQLPAVCTACEGMGRVAR